MCTYVLLVPEGLYCMSHYIVPFVLPVQGICSFGAAQIDFSRLHDTVPFGGHCPEDIRGSTPTEPFQGGSTTLAANGEGLVDLPAIPPSTSPYVYSSPMPLVLACPNPAAVLMPAAASGYSSFSRDAHTFRMGSRASGGSRQGSLELVGGLRLANSTSSQALASDELGGGAVGNRSNRWSRFGPIGSTDSEQTTPRGTPRSVLLNPAAGGNDGGKGTPPVTPSLVFVQPQGGPQLRQGCRACVRPSYDAIQFFHGINSLELACESGRVRSVHCWLFRTHFTL